MKSTNFQFQKANNMNMRQGTNNREPKFMKNAGDTSMTWSKTLIIITSSKKYWKLVYIKLFKNLHLLKRGN